MAFTKFGDSSYRFAFDSAEAAAIATATGVKPQELQISGEPEAKAEAIGTDGVVEAVAVGPDKRTFTLTGYVVDKSKFETVGLTFTFDSKFYIVMGRQRTVATREYEKAQLTGESYDQVTGVAS